MDKIKERLAEFNSMLQELSLEESIAFVNDNFEGKKVFSTSFGIEDQVLTHFLYPFKNDVSFFTLDTGRMFNETYEVFQKTQTKYKGLEIKTYLPNQQDVQDYIDTDGINGFYDSIESRKKCCFVRKVIPLRTALQGASVWVTGLRAEQSQNRESMAFLEWDEDNQLVKFNPLLHYTLGELETLVNQNNIPLNSLYKKGYLSIGCAPCTRVLVEGEDFRAGRWWWENGKKECGLHIHIENNN
ncbi:phosphoadenylyl-sulfate reductase [Flavobacterium sp. J27]|uniref:phosphoadenylyl-sulfate reductase n=1 Tax=Flavobacterium sp. J27 TaxID=2060419 RepID=UPI001031AFEF|nr:phosphoadenylyl-sulfate reductase [Flavobacterium sp. J27]